MFSIVVSTPLVYSQVVERDYLKVRVVVMSKPIPKKLAPADIAIDISLSKLAV